MQNAIQTYRIRVVGLVQGVGFRPFIHRLVTEYKLFGTVDNRNDGVLIEINTLSNNINVFINAIKNNAPRASVIDRIEFKEISKREFSDFRIISSENNIIEDEITEVSPDIAVCDDCLNDIANQKYRMNYPLTNCTHCGPRFSIIKALPYDRPNTSMAEFLMCDVCSAEYQDITNRRFHAQPIACNLCGPHYEMLSGKNRIIDIEDILLQTAKLIDNEGVVALKGMGGYNLICNAESEKAVVKLRNSKHRDGKPMAVMFANEDFLHDFVSPNSMELKELNSWQRPIVLVNSKGKLPDVVSNGFKNIGCILPYLPFHYMLFEKCKTQALILTSANISGEPIIIDDSIAEQSFKNNTNAVVSYNRKIHNRVDDSVGFVVNNTLRLIRRSRGFVPSPIRTLLNVDGILAVGAELVNTFCIGRTNQAIPSQHIGDLKNAESLAFFEESIERYKRLFKFTPKFIACDLHPEYMSSKYAAEQNIELIKVQHHHAHMASCMLENGISDNVIAVIMDGTGLGTDGKIWGGEYFYGNYSGFERIAHFDYLKLPGGDMVTKQPWRSAISMLHSVYGSNFMALENSELDIPFVKQLDKSNVDVIIKMLEKDINSPLSSSAGRIFDVVAALLNICTESKFHAEAPMRLEDCIDDDIEVESYVYDIQDNVVVFKRMIKAIIVDIKKGVPLGNISKKFHNTIIDISVEMCKYISKEKFCNKIVLSGGVFQNRYLSTNMENKLQKAGFEVYVHNKVPANDGGIALGQLAVAAGK